MARGIWMTRFARWHIWLGWLVGVPLLLWTASGLVMVLKPVEEVRGEDRRIAVERQPLPAVRNPVGLRLGTGSGPVEMRSFVQRGHAITLVTDGQGNVSRFSAATGAAIPPLGERDAREAVATSISGDTRITAMRAYPADSPPLDFRRPIAVWQATLSDGTRVYVGRDSGEIEAVRTRWWRFYDFMWGLHIMDLQTREDAHNPFTQVFGGLALVGALLGMVLLFRRRKAKVRAR